MALADAQYFFAFMRGFSRIQNVASAAENDVSLSHSSAAAKVAKSFLSLPPESAARICSPFGLYCVFLVANIGTLDVSPCMVIITCAHDFNTFLQTKFRTLRRLYSCTY
jgi:hypothetical protein